MLLSLLIAILLWVAGPIAADGQRQPARKKAPAPAARPVAVPSVRTLRAERFARLAPGGRQQEEIASRSTAVRGEQDDQSGVRREPREHRLRRAGTFDGDLRALPRNVQRREREEREGPEPSPTAVDPGVATPIDPAVPSSGLVILTPPAPAPAPSASFEGLDFNNFGAGHPPDTVGDVGPVHYIQSINSSVGIFTKATGVREAAFSLNSLMAQGNFGNLCDTNNFGDPVVLYDTFEDRWVITDFAFTLTGGSVNNPPGAFQCFAVSKSGDPLTGGWNFYSINITTGLNDYPKFGVWPDGIYMSANMFDFAAGGPFQSPRVVAFNKAEMYAGAPTVKVVSFDAPANDFTLLPSNARLQTGTPPAGTPNYFLSTWRFTNALTIYKFHADWMHVALSTFTGPELPIAPTAWPNAAVANAPSLGGNALDVLQIRAMMQNQYSNIDGVESLWATHTVRRATTTGFAAPRWYQVDVTGGAVPTIPQATTWDPDGANVMHRFMPSLALDRAGNMALGYSTSSATTKPAIKYAGRLATDPLNTFSQTEQLLIQGAGTQVGNCGGSACTRWGDYSAMSLDPDGCTFWYTNMYYQADGLNHNTRIGAFTFPACTTVTQGSLQGTVRDTGGAPLGGALVALGSRTTTADVSGFYTFLNLPAGTYPSVAASHPGYDTETFAAIVVSEGATATQDFALGAAVDNACFIDTSLVDFRDGTVVNCDVASNPGDVILTKAIVLDQQQLNNSGTGNGMSATTWLGQTFVPAISGPLVRLDLSLFCATCSGVNPAIVVELRTASGGLPTSTVLATTSVPGFSSGAATFYTATFASPAAVAAGTQYAYTVHPSANRTGTYAAIFSLTPGAYANGDRVVSTNSGAAWAVNTTLTPPAGATIATARDLSFRTFIDPGYAASGTFVSSLKDANPANGATATWLAINWNASQPSGTAVALHVGASDNALGPFNFVGPDGTAATSFASGDSLAQFNGKRYLKYRATLTTSNGAVTPALNDVTICFQDVKAVTTLAVDPASGDFGGSTTISATLTAGATGLVGKPIAFFLNGSPVGTAVTNGVGFASVSGVSLAGIDAGTYPGAVTASFAGDLGYTPSTGSNTLTVAPLPQTINFAPLADKVATDPPFTVSATGGASGNAVTFSTDSTACSVAGDTVTLNAAGSCAIKADQAGNTNYTAAPRVTQTFNIAFASQTISFGALANKTYGDPDFTVSATASSGLAVSFAAAGACSVSGSTVHIVAVGTCDITASQGGDARYSPAPPVTRSFSIGQAAGAFTNLVNPPIVLSSLLTTLHGRLGPAGLTTGASVTVTFGGQTRTASVAADGSFSAVFLALLLPPSPGLPVTFSFAGSATVTPASATSTVPVLYAQTGNCVGDPGHVVLPPLKPNVTVQVKKNTTVPVRFRVCNAFHLPVGWIPVVSHFYFMGNTAGATTPVSEITDRPFTFETHDLWWEYELKTKTLVSGLTYYYRILLNDGTTIDFSFKVKN